MSKFIEKKLTDIFTPHQGNAIYTRKNVVSLGWEGNIPVISSDVDNTGILCYIAKNKLQREKDLINYPCITWTVDGMAGTLTARNYPFVPNNHCGWLTPKVEGLDLDYLVFVMQAQFYNCAKNSSNKKVGNNQIKNLTIKLPIKDDGNFDLEEQQRLAGVYSEIENQKQKLLSRIYDIQELLIHIDKEDGVEYEDVPLNSMVTHHNGNASYTKTWCQNHKGEYPIYSANNLEPISHIESYDYDGEYLTYSKNGCAGYITILKGCFSINGDRCVMSINDEYAGKINLLYLKYYLEPVFRKNKKGRLGAFGKNEFTKLNSTMIKNLNIKVPIPLTTDGFYDFEKQEEFAARYKQIDEIKQGLIDKIIKITSINIIPE